jgi:hypothetical protein
MDDMEVKLMRFVGDSALDSRANKASTLRESNVRKNENTMKTTASTRPN